MCLKALSVVIEHRDGYGGAMPNIVSWGAVRWGSMDEFMGSHGGPRMMLVFSCILLQNTTCFTKQ